MYYRFGATDKCSTKGLSKRHNEIDKKTFLDVLTKRRSGSRMNPSEPVVRVHERAGTGRVHLFLREAQVTRRPAEHRINV